VGASAPALRHRHRCPGGRSLSRISRGERCGCDRRGLPAGGREHPCHRLLRSESAPARPCHCHAGAERDRSAISERLSPELRTETSVLPPRHLRRPAAAKCRGARASTSPPAIASGASSTAGVISGRGWSREFDDPIGLPDGGKLRTLRDAATHGTGLPKKEAALPEWQARDRGAHTRRRSRRPDDVRKDRRRESAEPPRRTGI
jgi:hypothetical protein